MCASANAAIYGIKMTKQEGNGNLVMLQPRSVPFFSEKDDFIVKYEVDQSSINSPSFMFIHYYFEGDIDEANSTTMNALINEEI